MAAMTHEQVKIALMGYLDGELDRPHRKELEDHLSGCSSCRGELNQFRAMKEVLHPMKFKEPSDPMWEEYWTHLYNRMERGVGWIAISIGSIILLSYGLIQWVKEMLPGSNVPWFLRGAIFLVVVGLVILLISAARERLYLHRRERYQEVKR